jgi:hypothetical protein
MPSVSLSDLKAAVYAKLDQNDQFFREAEVTWAINEGIRLGNLFCNWLTDTIAVYGGGVTIADRAIYRVPDGIAIPQRVAFNGKELDKVGLFQLFRQWPQWMKDTTATTGYPVNRWCPYSLNRFAINPADAVGGGTLEVTGVINPTPLVNDTDTITIPKYGILVVADYAAHTVQCKLGSVPLTQSMPQYRTYEQMIKQARVWTRYKHPQFWIDNKTPE